MVAKTVGEPMKNQRSDDREQHLAHSRFDGRNTLSISSGERVLFAHSERCPCFELSVNRPDFRTHPRSIANYKLKNHVVTTKPLRRITRYEASDTGVCVDFDDCLRVHIVFEGTIANMTLTPLKEYDTTFNRFSLRVRAHKAEAVYGCGEQFSYLTCAVVKYRCGRRNPALPKTVPSTSLSAIWSWGPAASGGPTTIHRRCLYRRTITLCPLSRTPSPASISAIRFSPTVGK